MTDENRYCSTCKWNCFDLTAWRDDNEFYCSNVDSDNYGIPTAFDDKCDDWDAIEGRKDDADDDR